MARAGNAASTAAAALALAAIAAAASLAVPALARPIVRGFPGDDDDALFAEVSVDAGARGESTTLAFVLSESPAPAGAPCGFKAEFIEFASPVVGADDAAPSPSPSAAR